MMLQRTGALIDLSAERKARRNATLVQHADGLTGWRRVRLAPKEVQERRELATILHVLPEHGHKVYTYSELSGEKMSGTIGIDWHPAGDLLRDLECEHVRAPISRTRVMGCLTIEQVACRDNVIAFVKRLIDPTPFQPEQENNFSDFEKENAANRDRLQEICRDLEESQLPDALHLWSAEVNGLRYFLTMDRKFRNVMRETKNIPLPCTPVLPQDALEELGVTTLISVPALADELWHPYREGHP